MNPTANKMGWMSDEPNEFSLKFIEFARSCWRPVLDIGAAYGVATLPALETGATVIANDIEPKHLRDLYDRAPAELRSRLKLVEGRFPDELDFEPGSLDAVHISNVIHFLSNDQVVSGLSAIHRWLAPGGRLFVLTATPYQATHKDFIPVFDARKSQGQSWPGRIENLKEFDKHPSSALLPDTFLVFDDQLLTALVSAAGFEVFEARMFSRKGLPEFCAYDGRENLGLVAAKPG